VGQVSEFFARTLHGFTSVLFKESPGRIRTCTRIRAAGAPPRPQVVDNVEYNNDGATEDRAVKI
jgi:hypothetical protein